MGGTTCGGSCKCIGNNDWRYNIKSRGIREVKEPKYKIKTSILHYFGMYGFDKKVPVEENNNSYGR